MNPKLFGTDGIRGLLNCEPLTVENVLRVGRALASVIKEHKQSPKRPRVVIGKDTRLSGYTIETALQSGLCSMGVDVLLVGPLPTPAIAHTTVAMGADAGIMITASHNPFYDNGIKIFTREGYKLSDQDEALIEERTFAPDLVKPFEPKPESVGKAKRVEDASGRYISSLKSNFIKGARLDHLTMVLDCANGAAYKVAPSLFEEMGALVVTMGCNPDGKNINDQVGALYPQSLAAKVKEIGADLGIALDGDADRLIVVDETGHVLDGDDFLSIMMDGKDLYPHVEKGIVGTLMTNYGLEKKCKAQGIAFYRANVGDRYVAEMLKMQNCFVGGETSGHLIDLTKATTGDGILSAILLLNVLVHTQKKLSQFSNSFTRYPQQLKSMWVSEKKPIESIPNLQKAIEEANRQLEGKGRSLTRYSGTENKIRVMVEADDSKLMNQVLDHLCAVVEAEMGIDK